jgi:hypothetical protein
MVLRLPPLARLLLGSALATALLGGCGGSSSSPSSSGNGLASKSPDQIVAAAKAAAAGAATVHISGSIINENKPISLDMELVAGKGAKGHIALEGLGIDVVAVEHAFYLDGSAAFYRHVAGAAAAQLLQGKWLKAPASGGSFASLAQLTDLTKLVDSTLASHGALKSAGTTTVGGQQAVGVTDTTKGGTLYVAATGTPYPLEISKGGTSAGRIVFNRWNQPVTLTPPPNPININQLQSGH